ncbi:hypothetical protein S4A8_02560 [Salinisphaera sp. S4-8]|uniref:hypothetical protein n=1 Tax=Salinisphaera sp. S4-8 TaxID=633357 RepID=UPI0033418C12
MPQAPTITVVYCLLALLAALGVIQLGRCSARLRQRRVGAASRSGMGGGLCLAIAALMGALLLNLHTYQRLSYEQPVAQLHLQAVADQRFQATLTRGNATPRVFELAGDEFQLDARVLKWRAWANLLGFDALFRLERLSGRYRDIDDEQNRPRSVIALDDTEPGVNAFALARRMPDWARLVDARYGSATYLPMADGAAYDIALTQSGLIARPANGAARAAIDRW